MKKEFQIISELIKNNTDNELSKNISVIRQEKEPSKKEETAVEKPTEERKKTDEK